MGRIPGMPGWELTLPGGWRLRRPLADLARVGRMSFCLQTPMPQQSSGGHQTLLSDVHVIVVSPLRVGTVMLYSPRGTTVTGGFLEQLKLGANKQWLLSGSSLS